MTLKVLGSPRHSITNMECREDVFYICQIIAQNSDAGREVLIDANVLQQLSHLATSQMVIEVVSACKILKALAHTGTFRNAIVTTGLKDAMDRITRYKLGAFHSRR